MSQERPWRSYPQKLDAGEDAIEDPLGPPILWPDGCHLAASGLGRIFLWELGSGKCIRALATEAVCRDSDSAFTLTSEPQLGRVLEGHRIREFACLIPCFGSAWRSTPATAKKSALRPLSQPIDRVDQRS